MKFPVQGTVLWAIDADLSIDVFRSGAASKPNTEYLRYIDLGIEDNIGRIEPENYDLFTVKIGQGISLFLHRMIPQGLVVMDASQWKEVEKKKKKKLQWWSIEQKQVIPSGLQLVYDGVPPGHCTLTVTREMTVSGFLSLVSEVPFFHYSTDLIGPS
jgi:hypothetical protein